MTFPIFGPGILFLTRTDITGATPIEIGYAQEVTIDQSSKAKALYGRDRYALAIGQGPIDVTVKVKSAEISPAALNAALYGGTFTAGAVAGAIEESHTVSASPFQVTVANASYFDTDLGVIYKASRLPLTKVASSGAISATGQYANASGVYTFASGDSGSAILNSYAYDPPAASGGETLLLANTPIGTGTTLQIDFFIQYQGNIYYTRVYNCVGTKLSQGFKIEDFMMPDFEFMASANNAGNVFEFGFPQVG